MNKIISRTFVSLLLLVACSMSALAGEKAEQGVHAFKACYETNTEGMVGAPVLNIKVIVDSKPKKMATGKGIVTWPSVGPDFETIKVPVEGAWYDMCTNDSCNVEFKFSSPSGARGLMGKLKDMQHWGSPGKFEYEFDGSKGMVEQAAGVCN